MRLFLAVFPPPAVQRAARAVSDALRHPGDGVSWVRADNLHYTMRFLGEVGTDGARRAAEAARAAAAAEPAFEAALGAPGAFPDARRARVIWLGLARGAEPLVRLARALESELRTRGFDRADKPFAAHLTLGRVREAGADWTPRLAAVAPSADATFRVERLCVVESELSPGGSIYRVRDEAPLS
jgi:RNA 2',3'-cyclic 3'-phosphodiesterase